MSNPVQWVPLSSVLETIVDNRGKTVPTSDSGFPLIATNCIKETSIYPTFENVRYVDEETLRTWFRAHLKPNDILFVNKGTPGRVCLVPDPVTFCAAQDMVGFRADPSKIDYRYLFAFLRSDWVKQTIANNHVGLVIPHFRKQDLDTLSVPLREMKDQQMIGGLYLLLSEKIELNQRMNEELEGMAKLLYDYWFVQYDFPMSAAQAAALGKPHLAGQPYRASGGPMTYHETLKREIPKGWEVKEVGEVLAKESQTKKIPASEVLKSGRFPVVDQSKDFVCGFTNDGDAVIEGTPQIIFGDHTRILKFINFAFARGADGTQLLMSNTTRLPPPLFYQALQRIDLSSYGYARHFKFLKQSKVLLPEEDIAAKYERVAMSCYDLIRQNLVQTQELTTLRDWLLPMLMNGQVVVS